jgi:hypothetical protein
MHTLLKGSAVNQENIIKVFEALKGRPITDQERAEYLAHLKDKGRDY